MAENTHPPTPSSDALATANRAHFDQYASKADQDLIAVQLPDKLAPEVLNEYNFDLQSTTVLDFACGTGQTFYSLVPRVKSMLGVDISQGMVDQYNLRATTGGILPEKMRAVRVELKGEDGELDGQTFDVVMCSLAYHHIADVEATTRTLVHFLKPGGTLLVMDFIRSSESVALMSGATVHGEHGHGHGHGHSHHHHGHAPGHAHQAHHDHPHPQAHHHGMPGGGFAHTIAHAHVGGFVESDMAAIFAGAGLEHFAFRRATTINAFGMDMEIFIARGTRPI